MSEEKLKRLKLEVRKIFTAYLEIKKQRKTPERYAILDEIYTHKIHFDVETLYIQMKKRNYQVSRATVYNTLDNNISGISQQQGGNDSLTFSSQYGTILVSTLPIISGFVVLTFPSSFPRVNVVLFVVIIIAAVL